jgi:hypothetical protein
MFLFRWIDKAKRELKESLMGSPAGLKRDFERLLGRHQREKIRRGYLWLSGAI